MSDDQTGSVWTHFDGSVLTGPLAGTGAKLVFAPLLHTTWAEWQEQQPDTTVLDWYDEFAEVYARYENVTPGRGNRLNDRFQETLLNEDERLEINELVIGVNIGSTYQAYVLSDFRANTAVNETIETVPVVVLIEPENISGLAFVPEIDGALVEIVAENGRFVDERGNEWNANGQAVSGPDEGAQLPFVTSFVTEWYGWAAYHPETTIYNR